MAAGAFVRARNYGPFNIVAIKQELQKALDMFICIEILISYR